MKKLLPLLLLSTAVIGVVKVNAESSSNDYYYTNPNGINLTEKEYNLVKNMFDERFLEVMNQEDYDYINRLVNTDKFDYVLTTTSAVKDEVNNVKLWKQLIHDIVSM